MWIMLSNKAKCIMMWLCRVHQRLRLPCCPFDRQSHRHQNETCQTRRDKPRTKCYEKPLAQMILTKSHRQLLEVPIYITQMQTACSPYTQLRKKVI